MKALLPAVVFAGAFAVATAASAQPANDASGSSNPPGTAATRGMDHTIGTNTSGTNPGGDNAMSRANNAMSGQKAASGDDNQAVATTSMNAPQPAHGNNSFTKGQAKGRISDQGFQDVRALHLNSHGVWWGKATKNGEPVKVWLDYKGNVGHS